MQFLGVAHIRPRSLAYFRDGGGIEPPDLLEHRVRQNATHFHGASAAFFERSVIEIRVWISVQNLVRKLRRHRCIDRQTLDRAGCDAEQHTLKTFDVHCFGKDVLHHFADQRVIGNADITGCKVLRACLLLRKDRSQQIIRSHPLNVRRNFLSTAETKQSQRAPGVPAPPRSENRRCQNSLLENRTNRIRMKKMKNVRKRETMLLAQRNIQSVVGRGSLQLKIERAAEALTQCQAPGFVDTPAKWRVDYKLHAATFIKEAFGDDRCLTGDRSQDRTASEYVFDCLFSTSVVETAFKFQPTDCRGSLRRRLPVGLRDDTGNKRADLLSQRSDVCRKLVGPRRRFAAPEWNGGRRTLRVFH